MFSCTKIFSEKEECDIVDTMYKLMCDYFDENPTKISEPDFNDEMICDVMSAGTGSTGALTRSPVLGLSP